MATADSSMARTMAGMSAVGAVVFGHGARGIDPDCFGLCPFFLFGARKITVVYLMGGVQDKTTVLRLAGVFVEGLFKPDTKLAGTVIVLFLLSISAYFCVL